MQFFTADRLVTVSEWLEQPIVPKKHLQVIDQAEKEGTTSEKSELPLQNQRVSFIKPKGFLCKTKVKFTVASEVVRSFSAWPITCESFLGTIGCSYHSESVTNRSAVKS